MRKNCPGCSNPVEQHALKALTVEDSLLRLTVDGMPAALCTKGHTSPVDGAFMLWMIQELKERAGALPAGEEKGLLLKKYHCACGKALPSQSARREAFPAELAYEGSPAFRAQFEASLYRCEGCGKEQLRSAKEAQKHVSLLIAALNDAAKFPHA